MSSACVYLFDELRVYPLDHHLDLIVHLLELTCEYVCVESGYECDGLYVYRTQTFVLRVCMCLCACEYICVCACVHMFVHV